MITPTETSLIKMSYAITDASTEKFQALLSSIPKIEIQNIINKQFIRDPGETLLTHALQCGAIPIVHILLDTEGINPNQPNEAQDNNPVLLAIHNVLLPDNGLDEMDVDKIGHEKLREQFFLILQRLLEMGGNPHATTIDGLTTLKYLTYAKTSSEIWLQRTVELLCKHALNGAAFDQEHVVILKKRLPKVFHLPSSPCLTIEECNDLINGNANTVNKLISEQRMELKHPSYGLTALHILLKGMAIMLIKPDFSHAEKLGKIKNVQLLISKLISATPELLSVKDKKSNSPVSYTLEHFQTCEELEFNAGLEDAAEIFFSTATSIQTGPSDLDAIDEMRRLLNCFEKGETKKANDHTTDDSFATKLQMVGTWLSHRFTGNSGHHGYKAVPPSSPTTKVS